jgi:hypothetical protein
MESDPGEIASRCRACDKLFAQTTDECPSCHATCEKTNDLTWQAIALFAAQKHVSVYFVEPGHGLDKHAGVVALLAREARWVTPPERVLTASLPEPRA